MNGTGLEGVLDPEALRGFATALLIGALVGIEREKRKAPDGGATAGLRTFIVVAEVGAIAGWLAASLAMPLLVVAAVAAVAAAVVAGYVMAGRARPADLGLTTEMAAIAVCLLGAMTTLGHADIAVGLAIATAAVLAYEQPLHGLVERIGWDDLFAGLRLLIASFIVLPLLPDRPVDPLGALNPHSLWLLVILISSLSLVGYVATRWLGSERGAAVTGLTGGLVSSTAVTLAFARQSRDDVMSGNPLALASGMALAWGVMFVRVAVEVLVVNRDLLPAVIVPMGAMALVSAAAAGLFFRRAAVRAAGSGQAAVPIRNPFSLTAAAKFAVLFAVVLVVVELVRANLPTEGLYVVAAVAGLTDVDAITLSMAGYARTGDPEVAVRSIILAALSNTLVKCALAAGLGGPALRRPVILTTAAIMAAGLGAMALA